MDPPANGDEVKPEKLEEAKDAGPMYHCDLFDSEVVHKIAEALLPGLASACVDNTTGDLIRNAGSVAVDIRREMVDYLTNRSETFVAELMVLDGDPDAEVSDHPFDIVSDFIDNFVSSKKNIWSKVSTWILSDRREDRIDDFVQEMELDGFWLMGRREAVARTLVKNVDFKNEFHCNMKFKSPEELDEHRLNCNFKTINCENEGCNARFSAGQLEHHDSICPFKIIPCEQQCPEILMRREMDRHCITVCPMKLVNCPFYPVGCKSTIPQCKINEHRLDGLQDHLVCVLQGLYKQANTNDLKKRAEQITELSSPERLVTLRDARSLAYTVKDLDSKLGPLEITKPEPEPGKEDPESIDKTESPSSTTSEANRESIDKKETSASPDPTSGKDLDTNLGPLEQTKLKPRDEDPESVDKKERPASPEKPTEEDPESASPEPLAASSDTRSAPDSVEDLDAKLGPPGETETKPKPSDEDGESIDRKQTSDSSNTHDKNQVSIGKNEESASSSSSEEGTESPSEKGEVLQSTTEDHKGV